MRMAQPLVSIVTPSLNQGRFIRATIESVLSQNYQPIEYIVMDGGSIDETAAIVKDYASRLTWISEKDRGQSHAINKGFRMAKGSVLAWINSDDLILPDAVRHAVEGLDRHPAAGAVYGEGYLIDQDGKTTGRFPWTEPFDLWKLTHLLDYILQQTVYFRREAIEQVGFLREDLHYVMDWDVLIRIGRKYGLQYIPEYMGCLREYPEAKSFAGGRARIQEIGELIGRSSPGYRVYALHAYRQLWCDWIGAHFPRAIGTPAQRMVRFACGGLADFTQRREVNRRARKMG
jgi:glycosyltransferase involved in cell wall biosynthesis